MSKWKINIGVLILIISGLLVCSCGSKPSAAQYDQATSKANSLVAENRCHEAIKEYHKALKFKETDAEIYRKIAECYVELNLPDSAVTYYEGAIIFKPKDIDSYQRVGDIYFNRQMYHEAMTWYDRALQIGHITPESYVKLGRIHQSWGDFDMAKGYFDLALASDSTNNEACFGLAAIAWTQGDTSTAIADYQKAALDGPNALAAYRLGMIYATQKKYDDALQWFDKCMTLEPDSQLSKDAYQRRMEIVVLMKAGQN